MIESKAEKQLKNLGLNSYEVKIWTALLSRGVSTAGELSDIANVPRSRSYDVLESLEKKGFVKTKNGKPARYTAISPSEALENTKKNTQETASEEIKKNPALPDSPDFPSLPDRPDLAVNLLITLIHQANYLIDKLIVSLKEKHMKEGGLTEELYQQISLQAQKGFSNLKELKKRLPEFISYAAIRIVLAKMKTNA